MLVQQCKRTYRQHVACIPHRHHNRFTVCPAGWAGARRKLLLDFMVLGRITRGRHTDNLDGRHSIQSNQQSTSINPPHYAGYPQPSQFILAWDRHRSMLYCIPSWPMALFIPPCLVYVVQKFVSITLGGWLSSMCVNFTSKIFVILLNVIFTFGSHWERQKYSWNFHSQKLTDLHNDGDCCTCRCVFVSTVCVHVIILSCSYIRLK